ncbi:Non-ribosomal peptide synthetase [Beggiatoa sp. SS]|nr:Non-ribosomal peptide synthetase [Beggiatoa sp. SS]
MSYQELNDKSNQLAHYLLKHPTLENASNPLIAICVERSREMVIGLLGILKAGGAYVPIDPNYPAKRIAYLLKDSATPVLLTQSALKAQLPVSDSSVICLDQADFASQSTQNPARKTQPDELAYLIYTSRSTGRPKGVMLEHRGAVHLAVFQQQYFSHRCKQSRIANLFL